MSTFAIQCPVTGAEGGDLRAVIAGVRFAQDSIRQAASTMTAAHQPVTVLHSTYVPADRVCHCLVQADDAATVMEVLRRAGSRSARVLPAVSL